tara:strand:- start:203 stop:460 length:258 start_codon:yes stop_codon:yes gene_type:complete
MKEEIVKTIEIVATHPKTALLLAGATNLNTWYGTYEPIAKFATSILGIILVSVLIVKHVVELKETLKKNNSEKSKLNNKGDNNGT